MHKSTTILMVAGVAISGGTAMGDYTITQGTSGPTYATTLNFDEVGGPTGVVPDSWAGIGLSEMQAGDGVPQVGNFAVDHGVPWVGSGNSFFGNFGVFMTFSTDLTEMSFEVWDPSGPGGPFGGGMSVFIFDDGTEVASSFVEPAWGGIGDQFFDITTTGGMVFDEVRVLGFGFPNTTYMDNISWNAVPALGTLGLLGLAVPVLVRRRRA